MKRHALALIAAVVGATAMACTGPDGDRTARTSPISPDAAAGAGATTVATSSTPSASAVGLDAVANGGGGLVSLPTEDSFAIGSQAVDFPPRNEPFDFRANALEARYRDVLRRPAVSSFVDVEGTIVWTQEYLRYRVNRCGHQDAIQKVFDQIDGRGIQPVCGVAPSGNVAFPPRNEPFEFRTLLEAKYRDGLRRPAVQTFVDPEGDVIWTQEYLRYRVSSCSHSVAVDKVMTQIGGGGVQPDCASTAPPPPPTTGSPLVARFTVTGSSAGNGRCISPGSGPADCTFDASTSTLGQTRVSYSWEIRTSLFTDRTQFNNPLRPVIGCDFSRGVQTFQLTVTLVITDQANNNNRASTTQTVQGIRTAGNCGFNP